MMGKANSWVCQYGKGQDFFHVCFENLLVISCSIVLQDIHKFLSLQFQCMWVSLDCQLCLDALFVFSLAQKISDYANYLTNNFHNILSLYSICLSKVLTRTRQIMLILTLTCYMSYWLEMLIYWDCLAPMTIQMSSYVLESSSIFLSLGLCLRKSSSSRLYPSTPRGNR